MKQFMAGDIGPGEMGCGIELMVLTNTDHENTKYNTYIQIKKIMSVSTLNGEHKQNHLTLQIPQMTHSEQFLRT